MIRTLKLSLWLPIGVVVLSVIRFGFDPSFSTGFVPMLFSLPAMVFGLRLRLARRHPADARPGAAASGFPAGYIRVRGRTLSTLGGRRHHRRSVRTARHLDLRRNRLAPGVAGAVAPAVAASKARQGFRDIGPDPCNNALLVELRPILHIHQHPQTSKRFHLRFHLGRADHSERVK